MGKKEPTPAAIDRVGITCPQCGRKAVWRGNPHRPFCSERCRLIDLGCWAEETYRMAGEAVDQNRQDGLPGDEKEL
jgi:hypothetical protein